MNFRKKYYYRNLSYFTDYTSDYLKKHERRVTGLYTPRPRKVHFIQVIRLYRTIPEFSAKYNFILFDGLCPIKLKYRVHLLT